MSERLAVPSKDRVRVTEECLRQTVAAWFEKMGESAEDARQGADVLVAADLRGAEFQGVSTHVQGYTRAYRKGRFKPMAQWRVVHETAAMATVDADRGLEVIQGAKHMEIAIDKARNVGVGVVTVFNGGDSGGIGYYPMLAVQQDMIGMFTTGHPPRVLPAYGAEYRLGTNPIAVAAPTRNEPPFLFDVATSATAAGMVRLATRYNLPIRPGWVADADGAPIMQETQAPEEGDYRLLPFGGTLEGGTHKGYGFGLVAEILSTMLGGALPAMVTGGDGFNHYMAAYNIASFTNVETFKDNMDRMLRTLRETKPAPGHERVAYPGLGAYEAEQYRRANGIPIHKGVFQELQDLCKELSIPALKIL